MNRQTHLTLSIVCTLAFTAGACERAGAKGKEPPAAPERAEPAPSTAPVPPLSNDGADPEGDLAAGAETWFAAAEIAGALCEREERCGRVGAGQKYASAAACTHKIRLEWRVDLNRFDCPSGVVQSELDECLSAVRNEDCGRPLKTLKRLFACRASDICNEVPPE